MMKRFGAILLSLILLLSCASALAAMDERVFDRADLFTASDESEIMEAIAAFQQSTGMDFVVVTSDEEHEDVSQRTIASEFYDKGGFGLDSEHSGIIYYIDMYDRQEYLVNTGAMIDYMPNARIESTLDQTNPNLRAGRYREAVLAAVRTVERFVQEGIPEGQYRYDLFTGERLTARHKALTSTELLVSAIVGFLVAVIFCAIVHRRYKLKGSTYSYDYSGNSDLQITDRADDYIRTTVTRTRKAPPPSSGGGSGGGGGNGSGVFTSSSGTSHSGGGRGF
ncbi:MAG: TPM domain-containing protein [Eubacteriales bacterium]|nr:TPM domain-containing protein [Eubacteriales bacterium]